MSQGRLLLSRRFWPFFWAQFLGAFNDNVLKNALMILITYRFKDLMGLPSEQIVALSGGIFILPFFLFSATSGQLADKYDKATLIRWIKVAEVLIMALAAYGFLASKPIFLLVVLFLMGLHSTLFGPIKYSILPQLLTERELVGGNALIETGTFLSILIGTIAGGTLAGIESSGPLAISAVLLGASIAGAAVCWLVPSVPAGDPGIRIQWDLFRPTWNILRFTARDRTIWNAVLGISWFWFLGVAMISLFLPWCQKLLHADEAVVTLFLAVFSIGIGAGSLLCERLSGGRLELGLVPFGSIGMSAFAFDLYFSGAPRFAHGAEGAVVSTWAFLTTFEGARVLIDLLGVSVFGGFFIVPLFTLIQERSDLTQRSRVIAGNNIVNSGFMVVSSLLLAVFFAAGLKITQIFATLAAMNLAVAIYIYTLVPEFLVRFVCWILARLIYSLRVDGHENVPESGPAILVCNHVTFVDWLIIFAAVKRPVRFVMYYKFAKGPFMRWLMRQTKVIPIAGSKENPAIMEAAFASIRSELEAGELVCIFPEGMLTLDGQINPFKPGVERALAATPVPVVPMALQGLWPSFFSRNPESRSWKRFPWLLWMPVRLKIGAPVAPSDAKAAELQSIVTALRASDDPLESAV